jgi:CHRD domain
MKGRVKVAVAGALVASAAVAGTVAFGTGNSIQEKLSGYQEDPLVLSTSGSGAFQAQLLAKDQKITYELSYRDLEGDVTQAHIHLGGAAQSGGIIAFLCTNLPGGPPGAQPCPPAPATITGTITPADVIGPAAQGIAAGEFGELAAAIRGGVTYANVHSTKYPGGEIRAQLHPRKD